MKHENARKCSRARRRETAFVLLAIAVLATACVRDETALTADDTGDLPGAPPPGTTPTDDTPPPVDPNPPVDPPPTTDVAAFQQTLFPLLRDPANFCVACHGAAQIPTFAVDDVVTAYNVIVSQQKVNLEVPDSSRVYLRPAVDRHNCGANASCDRIADDFLAAIADWAQLRPEPDPSLTTLTSAKTSFALAAAGASARVTANEIALFEFDEGMGTTTVDTSGVGTPMTLQIDGMEWVEGGLRNVSGKAQASLADSRKLFDRITATGQYSIEAWLIPQNTTQDGPARIVSYSTTPTVRNFMLGQNAIYYRFRNRSAATNANGDPFLESVTQDVTTNLQHVVMAFDPAVGRKTYVNGELSVEESLPGALAWTNDQLFVIGNEVTNDRVWQGVFQLVAIHDKALSAAEVQQNFAAGAGDYVTLQFDVSAILGNPARIDMLAMQLDDAGYVFAKPTFVGSETGIRVKNIRIAVNDSVPVAAQAFRRVDTTVSASGTELSRLGTVIPVALGREVDQFHLELEMLGGRVGRAEAVAPAAPPIPAPDVPEPVFGVRSFSKVNDTLASLTGVAGDSAIVSALYFELRDSLPGTDDLNAFGSSQQIAIQRLATAYCGQVVAVPATCTSFFGACTVGAAAKTQIADRIYDRLIGPNLANQPDRAGTTAELVDMFNDLSCTNGCTGVTAQTALQATCAAALSSAAVTIN